MEPVGAFPDGEWDCFRRMFASDEEHDYYSPQFLGQSSLLLGEHDHELNNINGTQSMFCSAPVSGENYECMFYSFDAAHVSQENSYSSNCSSGADTVFNIANLGHAPNYYLSYRDHDDHVLADNNNNNNPCISMDFNCMDDKFFTSSVPSSFTDIVMEENNVNLNEDAGSDRILENSDSCYTQIMEPIVFPTNKRKVEVTAEDHEINNKSEIQKKKPRVLKDGQGCMKNARSKKNQKLVSNIGEEAEETNNTGSNGQSSSSNISEDDNASQENSTGGATSGSKSALNSNGKTRASRGSATDPQSLYARKRRERINERLRILQNLVPNGTKVDISTMLEEAVNYVKFLQLQIKLLSSDDLWMYAPLAYNGLDIGLNLNLKSTPPPL